MTYQVIYKYPVPPAPSKFILMLPKGAEILCVQMQSGEPQIWALVDPGAEEEERKFVTLGTGRQYKKLSKSQYIGTFQTPFFVWHVFEI